MPPGWPLNRVLALRPPRPWSLGLEQFLSCWLCLHHHRHPCSAFWNILCSAFLLALIALPYRIPLSHPNFCSSFSEEFGRFASRASVEPVQDESKGSEPSVLHRVYHAHGSRDTDWGGQRREGTPVKRRKSGNAVCPALVSLTGSSCSLSSVSHDLEVWCRDLHRLKFNICRKNILQGKLCTSFLNILFPKFF